MKINTIPNWIAIDRLGHRFLNVIVSSRDTETGQCLWEGVARLVFKT